MAATPRAAVDRVVGKAGESQDLRAATASRLPGRRARVRGRPRTQRDRGGSGEALSAVRWLAARKRLCSRARPPVARCPVRLRGGQGRLRAEARCDGAGDPHADDPARRGRGGEHRLRCCDGQHRLRGRDPVPGRGRRCGRAQRGVDRDEPAPVGRSDTRAACLAARRAGGREPRRPGLQCRRPRAPLRPRQLAPGNRRDRRALDTNDRPDPRPLVRAARPLARGRRPSRGSSASGDGTTSISSRSTPRSSSASSGRQTRT